MKHVPLWTFAQTAGLATVLIIRKKKVKTLHHDNLQYETELDPERERERERQRQRQRQRQTDRQTDRQKDRQK